MDIKAETLTHLTEDEQSAIHTLTLQASYFRTLDRAQEELRAWFPDWFIYRGGHHIALHRTANDERRCLLITD